MTKLYDGPLLGNPISTKKPKKSTKRGSRPKKGKTMSKKSKKGKRNPLGLSLSGVKGPLVHGAALGAGLLLAEVTLNHLPLPQSLQGGIGEAAVTVAVGFGLHYLAKKVKATAPYADSFRNGAIALGIYKVAAPKLLPILAFTNHAKAAAAIDTQALSIVARTNAANTAQQQGQGGQQGTGDAFVMSRGGLTTADRAPRDTAALAGVGDSYAAERPGFSGAPNGLRRPWGDSIYSRQ